MDEFWRDGLVDREDRELALLLVVEHEEVAGVPEDAVEVLHGRRAEDDTLVFCVVDDLLVPRGNCILARRGFEVESKTTAEYVVRLHSKCVPHEGIHLRHVLGLLGDFLHLVVRESCIAILVDCAGEELPSLVLEGKYAIDDRLREVFGRTEDCFRVTVDPGAGDFLVHVAPDFGVLVPECFYILRHPSRIADWDFPPTFGPKVGGKVHQGLL